MYSNDSAYLPPVSSDILATTNLNFKSETINLSYLTDSYSIELNQFTMNSNQISNVLGNVNTAVIVIQGFVKIVHQNNIFLNNGRYLINQIVTFGAIRNFNLASADSNYSPAFSDFYILDTYGFLEVNNSMSILIENNTITNHFFTYGNFSEISPFGSYITFNQVYGNITVNNLYVSNMTGLLNDYNINTLDIFNGFPFGFPINSSNFLAYQFIPVFAFSSPNLIVTFNVTNWTMTNITATLNSPFEAGILFSIFK